MALILNLETATTNCSVSLARDGETLSIRQHNSVGYSHSEQLHHFIYEVLSEANQSPASLDAVAVSAGPGSYTGLRIGTSAAKGMCFALDIPLIAIPTLNILAHQISVPDGLIIPLLDARRMEVYSAVYDRNYHQLRATEAEIIDEEAFSEYTVNNAVCFVGSGAQKCQGLLDHPNVSYCPFLVPSALEMSQLSYNAFVIKQFEDLAYFEPSYLKDFLITAPGKG